MYGLCSGLCLESGEVRVRNLTSGALVDEERGQGVL